MTRARPFVSTAPRLFGLLVAMLTALALAPSPALAQDAREQAKQAYQRGKQMFDAGNFTGAIVEFERAKQLASSPVLDFNIGLAHDRLGNAREAVDSYRSYLQAVPNAPNKSTVESRIAALEPQIAEQMQPLPPAGGPAEQAPSAPAGPAGPTAPSVPEASPPPGVAPPVAPPAEALAPDAPGPGAAAPPAPPVDERLPAAVAPRIPLRTGVPELDRVIGIDLQSVRAQFRGPAVGPPQR